MTACPGLVVGIYLSMQFGSKMFKILNIDKHFAHSKLSANPNRLSLIASADQMAGKYPRQEPHIVA